MVKELGAEMKMTRDLKVLIIHDYIIAIQWKYCVLLIRQLF